MVNFNFLLKKLKSINTKIYMLIGNGSKNQFRYISDLKNTLAELIGAGLIIKEQL